jgi:pimeloyl-ACP methyl ester carboxylesterase
MRSLAISLAAKGFVTLRFDYDGTGDSSGGVNDAGRDELWIASVVEATSYLRSLGLETVSAVGMRLGATLIGVAADRHQLDFSAIVLWDPCDSGRSFLREINALEALRRDDFHIVAGAPVETSEFVFSTRTAEEIRRVELSTTSVAFGERVLIVSRVDRVMSKRLLARLANENAEWQTTDEQATLLDVDPMQAVLPQHTLDNIVAWLCATKTKLTSIDVGQNPRSAVVTMEEGRFAVNEHIIEIGPERLFAIVTEPIGQIHGPLIVMFNAAIEEHTGPSRLWVDLSRRWAGYGVRSVRFDMRGLGDSPWPPLPPEDEFFFEDWLEDVLVVTRELNPDDASNSVFIGLCSGAYWATEAALELRARGVCVINPPMYIDALHCVRQLKASRHASVRKFGNRLKVLVKHRWFLAKHTWISAATWHVIRVFLPSAYSQDILAKLDDNNTELLLFYGIEEVWPYNRIPYLRSLDFRRLTGSSNRRIEFVSGLDHGMHFADGRARAIEILDRHVLERFGGVTDVVEFRPSSEDS